MIIQESSVGHTADGSFRSLSSLSKSCVYRLSLGVDATHELSLLRLFALVCLLYEE